MPFAVRSLAFPVAVLALAVVPARADGPAPDLPPPSGGVTAVRLVTRVIDVVPEVAARWRDRSHPAWRVLDDVEATRLLARQKGNVVSTATSDVALDQRATHEVLHTTSYIADYDVEVGGMGSCIVDPVVRTVVAGTHLEVTPKAGGGVLGVDVHHTWVSTIRAERMSLSTNALGEVTIQFPEVAGRTWQGDVSVPNGGHLLLLGAEGFPSENGKARLLLVTPSVVPEATPGK